MVIPTNNFTLDIKYILSVIHDISIETGYMIFVIVFLKNGSGKAT